MPKSGPRPHYRIVSESFIYRLYVGRTLLAHLPEAPASAAELRRIAEHHAGHELNWRGGRVHECQDFGGRHVLWMAPVADSYAPVAA